MPTFAQIAQGKDREKDRDKDKEKLSSPVTSEFASEKQQLGTGESVKSPATSKITTTTTATTTESTEFSPISPNPNPNTTFPSNLTLTPSKLNPSSLPFVNPTSAPSPSTKSNRPLSAIWSDSATTGMMMGTGVSEQSTIKAVNGAGGGGGGWGGMGFYTPEKGGLNLNTNTGVNGSGNGNGNGVNIHNDYPEVQQTFSPTPTSSKHLSSFLSPIHPSTSASASSIPSTPSLPDSHANPNANATPVSPIPSFPTSAIPTSISAPGLGPGLGLNPNSSLNLNLNLNASNALSLQRSRSPVGQSKVKGFGVGIGGIPEGRFLDGFGSRGGGVGSGGGVGEEDDRDSYEGQGLSQAQLQSQDGGSGIGSGFSSTRRTPTEEGGLGTGAGKRILDGLPSRMGEGLRSFQQGDVDGFTPGQGQGGGWGGNGGSGPASSAGGGGGGRGDNTGNSRGGGGDSIFTGERPNPRRLWSNVGPNSNQGPGSLGGTPTRNLGIGNRNSSERTHSRYNTVPQNNNNNGNNDRVQTLGGSGLNMSLSTASAGALGTGTGLERPLSAMSGRSGAGIAGGIGGGGTIVAGVVDTTGRMENQALIDLVARVARTESALIDLNQQVASLSTIVKGLQINANAASTLSAVPTSAGGLTPLARTSSRMEIGGEPGDYSASTPSVIETPAAADIQGIAGGSSSSGPDVAALTQQIAALSASVAQLQRMQSTSVRQGMEKRMNSTASRSDSDADTVTAGTSPIDTRGPTPAEAAAAAQGQGSQALRTPSSATPHPAQSPGPTSGSQQSYFPPGSARGNRPHTPRTQTGPPLNSSVASALGSIGSRPRPQTNRTSSNANMLSLASVAAGGATTNSYASAGAGQSEGGDRLGLLSLNLGPMSPGGVRDRMDPTTPGGAGRDGGPGGVTITKWEHLPLTNDLQRQILKYGIGPPNKIQARALPFMLRGSDIIAQAPPTQERIITYVIPVVQLVLSLGVQQPATYKGPCAMIITTTVDQATQANKLLRDVGAPLGLRTALAIGAGGADLSADLRNWNANAAHVLVGTPARINDAINKYAGNGGISPSEIRMLVLDEVDQLIARNLYDHVSAVCRVLPSPKNRGTGINGGAGVIGTPGAVLSPAVTTPFDPGMSSPFNPSSSMPFPSASGARGQVQTQAQGGQGPIMQLSATPERQTCIFSNTIPTDVINFSQSIQVRDPVRVLVRREGGPNTTNDPSSAGNLRHYYLYLALTSGAGPRAAEPASSGVGTIGSGRAAGTQSTEVNQAKEYKLEALADLLQEYPLWQAVIHVGTQATLDAVVNKLNSRQLENISLSADMSNTAKQSAYTKWRTASNSGRGPRFLVVFDVVAKPPDIVATPLVINFDLPRSVEGYAQRVAAALQSEPNRNERNRNPSPPQPASVIVNFIQAAGGDVEMLRSTECAYRFKCSEIPTSFRELF